MVVIAALFIAFAVIAAVAVERNTTVQLITRRDAAAAQLTRLANAIIEYGAFNATGTTLLYPCPARTDLLNNNADFGKAVQLATGTEIVAAPTAYANCSSIVGDVGGTPVTTVNGYLTVLGVGNGVVRGMVPVQNLSQYGTGANDAFDPWNNRIMYVVNRNLTRAGSGANAANPTVTDARTNYAIPAPDFILISYGRDGVGGIRRGSTTVSITCTSPSSVLRFDNCEVGDAIFKQSPTYTASSAGATTYFDDVITYYRQ